MFINSEFAAASSHRHDHNVPKFGLHSILTTRVHCCFFLNFKSHYYAHRFNLLRIVAKSMAKIYGGRYSKHCGAFFFEPANPGGGPGGWPTPRGNGPPSRTIGRSPTWWRTYPRPPARHVGLGQGLLSCRVNQQPSSNLDRIARLVDGDRLWGWCWF